MRDRSWLVVLPEMTDGPWGSRVPCFVCIVPRGTMCSSMWSAALAGTIFGGNHIWYLDRIWLAIRHLTWPLYKYFICYINSSTHTFTNNVTKIMCIFYFTSIDHNMQGKKTFLNIPWDTCRSRNNLHQLWKYDLSNSKMEEIPDT